MDKAFSIGGRDFQLLKLDVLKQFHIVRRIGPILAEILAGLKGTDLSKDVSQLSSDAAFEHAGKVIVPLMNGLSKLSDVDADHVLLGLLSSVEIRQSAGNWAKVATPSMIMMQDMELPILTQIAGRAFMYNLSGFFAVHLQQ